MEKSIFRIYTKEEIKQMNLIFNKENGNAFFTEEELEYANKFDLKDIHISKIARIIWKYRDNKTALKQIQSIMLESNINEFNNVLEVENNEK